MKVLLIEDEPADARLAREMFTDACGAAFELSHAALLSEGLEQLGEGGFDVILLDLSLPDCQGQATFEKIRSRTALPVILLTGLEDEEMGLRLVGNGAQDYLVKGRVDADLLVRSARYAIERNRIEKELRRTKDELDDFAHTVSHDLRGPVSAAVIAVDMIEPVLEKLPAGESLEGIREALDIVTGSMDRATMLIEDLLAFAEAGESPREVVRVDVARVVAEVLDEKSGTIADERVEVNLDERLRTILASETHVYQVFSNLIGNAVKHNDCPEPVIEVRCLPGGEPGEHRYLIRDNGSGIPPENLEKVFLPFFRGGKAGGETGIGLATVEKIVKAYGGQIRAYNENGACFEFVMMDAEAAGK